MESLSHFLQLALALFAPAPLALAIVRWDGTRIGRHRGVPHEMVLAIFIWCVATLLGGHLLGLFGLLKPAPVATWNFIILATGLILYHRQQLQGSAAQPSSPQLPPAIIGSVFAVLVYRAFAFTPVGYDTYSYQLPEVARWILHGDFRLFSALARANIAYYHFGWNVTYAMMAVPLMRDTVIVLPNAIAWLGFALAIAAIGRELTGDRGISDLVATLVAVMPGALYGGLSALVDLPLAAFVLLAYYFGLIAIRHGASYYWALAALAFGVTIGTKTSGLGYSLAVAVALALQVATSDRSQRLRQLMTPRNLGWLMAGAIPAAFLAFFWMARNYHYTGSPLGVIDAAKSKGTLLLFTWKDIPHSELPALLIAVPRFVGASPLLLLLLGAGALSRTRPALRLLFPTLWLVASTGFLYTVTPFGTRNWSGPIQAGWIAGNLRFAFPFFAFLGILSIQLCTALSWNWKRLATLLIPLSFVHTMYITGMTEPSWKTSADLAFVAAPVAVVLVTSFLTIRHLRRGVSISATPLSIATLVLVFLAIGLYGLSPLRTWRDARLDGGIRAYLEHDFPKEETLLYLASKSPYYYYGPAFDIKSISHRRPETFNFFLEGNTDKELDLVSWMRDHRVSYAGIGPCSETVREYPMVLKGLEEGKLVRVWGKDIATEPVILKIAN